MSIGPTYDRESANWKAEVERLRNGIFPDEENPQSHVDHPREFAWETIAPTDSPDLLADAR